MSDRNKIMTQVVRNLEQVYDPEMPSISVIHLGLIYDIEILENNTVVKIKWIRIKQLTLDELT